MNYTAFQAKGISDHHLDARFDAKITNNDSIFVTWSDESGVTTISGGIDPTQLHNFPSQNTSRLATANYVHIFTPRLTNEFIFGYGTGYLVMLASDASNYLNSTSDPLNTLFQNTGSVLRRVYSGFPSAAIRELAQVSHLETQTNLSSSLTTWTGVWDATA